MKKIILITMLAASALMGSCEKEKTPGNNEYGDGPRSDLPAALQGNWMYGSFSMTEYWNQNPADYIGNAFELAMAFKFNRTGTYDHYFTSKTISGGIATYHQSLTRGTMVVNENEKTITTHAQSAHYKQTKNGSIIENRALSENEITRTTMYTYELRVEPNGTKSVYLKMNGSGNALPFLQKF